MIAFYASHVQCAVVGFGACEVPTEPDTVLEFSATEEPTINTFDDEMVEFDFDSSGTGTKTLGPRTATQSLLLAWPNTPYQLPRNACVEHDLPISILLNAGCTSDLWPHSHQRHTRPPQRQEGLDKVRRSRILVLHPYLRPSYGRPAL